MARQIIVELLADASKMSKGLDEASGKSENFGAKAAKALAIIGGTAGILKFGNDSVAAFEESAQAQSKLELALKNSDQTVGVHADAFAKLNTQLAKHTLADDDVIAATEAQMVTFGASKSQIQDMIPTVLDLAAKMGVSAPDAADLFDKASMGSVKALKTLGIEGYKPTGDKANDLRNIQGLLADKVKGAAQAQLDAAGPGAKMKKSMDELQESVGKLLVPALEKLSSIGATVTDWITNLSDPVKIAIGVVGGLAVAVWAINTAQEVWTGITAAVTAAQAALNAVMSANPIGLVVLAIAGLVAGFILAYQHCETFRNIVQGAFEVVSTVVQGVFNWVKDNWPLLLAILTGPIGLAVLAITTHWDTIKNGFTKVKDWIGDRINDVVGFFTGLPGRIGGVVSGMFDGIKDAFKGAVNWIIDKWNSLEFTIGGFELPFPPHTKFPSVTFGTPDIPRFHSGGVVPGSPSTEMLALLRGGETVVPSAGGAGTTINIYAGTIIHERDLADLVHRALLRKQGYSGNLGFEAA